MIDTRTERLFELTGARIAANLPETAVLFGEAHRFIPGGFTRARFFWPLPLYIDRGQGARIWDIDGREYVDCLMGFGAMILGHCHPRVVDAVRGQVLKGVHFGTAVREESELARVLTENVLGAERVIFVNSGTEATLAAMRIARAATGRAKIAKFEGGWHGWNDHLLHSTMRIGGEPRDPDTIPSSLGIPEGALADVVTLPFNDAVAIDLIRHRGGELACVVMEGVLGSAGCIPAEPAFVQEVRAACDLHGTLLVFDEVITGFRLGAAGAAGRLNVTADLTTLGKAIGGGLPVGAVCGRADLMDLIHPERTAEHVLVAGTFSGNPLTMTAGKAQLDVLLRDEGSFALLDRLGDRMRAGLRAALHETGVTGHVTGIGPLWGLHLFTEHEPTSIRDLGSDDVRERSLRARLALTGYLLEERVLMEAPVHLGFLSTQHTDAMIEAVMEAHVSALARMTADGFFAA